MELGKRLKQLREENGITQQELADILHVGRPTVAGYETKGKEPDYERLYQIAHYFGVTVDYLLGVTDDRINPQDREWRYPHVSNRLGSLIRHYREQNNLSHKQFSEQIQISEKLEVHIENGIYNPSIALLKKMATIMNLDFDYLIGGKKASQSYYDFENDTFKNFNFDMDQFFYARFEELCLRYGVSSINCEEKLGINKIDFNDMTYNRFPTLQELLKISFAFNVSVDYLVGRTDIRLINLTDDEIRLLLNYRDCTPQFRRNIQERAEKLSIESVNNSVAAETHYLDEQGKSLA